MREYAGIGGGIGPGRSADGRLIDIDNLVNRFQPLQAGVGTGGYSGMIQALNQRAVKGFQYQRGLAGSRHPGDAAQASQGNLGTDVLEIVPGGAINHNPATVSGSAF